MTDPFVTVVIRSFNRLPELKSLLSIVLGQRYSPFEVLIVDSTRGITDEDFERELGVNDANVRVVRAPPEGCAAAANLGMKNARGEIVAFVDDDDLPVGTSWLAELVEPLRDPLCLGANGRLEYSGEGPSRVPRVSAQWLRQRWMLSYGPFKKPRVFPGSSEPKRGIAWLSGGNSALRRNAWLRAGGWDEWLGYHNEHSLFLRLAKRLAPGEYLAYAPKARMVIRRDIAGGLDHRTRVDCRARVDTLARYYFWLVAREHPMRIWGLFPVFFPYFVFDSGVHSAELAEHTHASLSAQFVSGALYAPRAAWRHIVTRPPLPPLPPPEGSR